MTSLATEVVTAALGPGRPVRLVRPLTGGFSNEMHLVQVGNPDETFVLRVHRLDRAAIETAVAQRISGIVPVPEIVYVDGDVSLSRWVRGERLEDVLVGADAATGRDLGYVVGRMLAAIASVRFDRPGFFTGPDLEPSGDDQPASAQLSSYVRERLATQDDPLLRDYAALVCSSAHLLDGLDDPPSLVHSDYNPKNLLVRRAGSGWEVAAVLDWEFAFVGSSLVDVANMLRHPERLPPEYAGAFVAGVRDGGVRLSEGWAERARLLDVFALVDFLVREPPAVLRPDAYEIARRCIERGAI